MNEASNQDLSTQLDPVVNWDEVQGNLLLKHLHPLMMTPTGFLERNFVHLKGAATKLRPTKKPVIIRYGVDFVHAKIIHLFMPLLASGHDTDSIIQLVRDALEGIENGQSIQSETNETAP
jgi:hypothetical protein